MSHQATTPRRHAFLAFLLFLLAQAPDALAYFDPASGSLVLQMVLGGIAGVAVIVKLYWHKLLGLFGVGSSEAEEEDEGDEADEADEGDEEESAT